jgi:hypothetical protein
MRLPQTIFNRIKNGFEKEDYITAACVGKRVEQSSIIICKGFADPQKSVTDYNENQKYA